MDTLRPRKRAQNVIVTVAVIAGAVRFMFVAAFLIAVTVFLNKGARPITPYRQNMTPPPSQLEPGLTVTQMAELGIPWVPAQ